LDSCLEEVKALEILTDSLNWHTVTTIKHTFWMTNLHRVRQRDIVTH